MTYKYREITPEIEHGANYYPIVVLTGPRHAGKSTLCRHVFPAYSFYDLEDLSLRERIRVDPKGFLNTCGDKTVIDELQHIPELIPYLQAEVDEHPERRFILTGSNDFTLMEKITQSLAGRATMYTLLPMSLSELGSYSDSPTDLILYNGLFPAVTVGGEAAALFYRGCYSSYVERELPRLRNLADGSQFQKFMRVLAGRAACEFNASQIAAEIGVTSPTVKTWLTLLESSYVAFRLPPYSASINKRLTKTPKVYFHDTGMLCHLLGISEASQLAAHPLRGAIFENLAVVELLKRRYNEGKHSNLYFYRENKGREVDIVQEFGSGLDIYEVRSAQTFNKSFLRNLTYLKRLLGDRVSGMRLVYDGEPLSPMTINIRQIAEQ